MNLHTRVFHALKHSVAIATVLQFSDGDQEFVVHVEASDHCGGAMLTQKQGDDVFTFNIRMLSWVFVLVLVRTKPTKTSKGAITHLSACD